MTSTYRGRVIGKHNVQYKVLHASLHVSRLWLNMISCHFLISWLHSARNLRNKRQWNLKRNWCIFIQECIWKCRHRNGGNLGPFPVSGSARSNLRLCSANHRPGYWSNLPCDWPCTTWAFSEQERENGPWSLPQRVNKAVSKLSFDDLASSLQLCWKPIGSHVRKASFANRDFNHQVCLQHQAKVNMADRNCPSKRNIYCRPGHLNALCISISCLIYLWNLCSLFYNICCDHEVIGHMTALYNDLIYIGHN